MTNTNQMSPAVKRLNQLNKILENLLEDSGNDKSISKNILKFIVDVCEKCDFNEICRKICCCCDEEFCEDCIEEMVCDICDEIICSGCEYLVECSDCENKFCDNCKSTYECEYCNEKYCVDCRGTYRFIVNNEYIIYCGSCVKYCKM